MSAEIKQIRALLDETSHEAVEIIEELLGRLKSGQSIAVAFIEVKKGGIVATCFSTDNDCFHQLNSGAASLANRLANA